MKILVLSIVPEARNIPEVTAASYKQRSCSSGCSLADLLFRFVVHFHVVLRLILVHVWVVLRMTRVLVTAGVVVGEGFSCSL